ncbi:hypothetical protein HDZ31DRAFT_68244 [Schizophyllum fasciatum]
MDRLTPVFVDKLPLTVQRGLDNGSIDLDDSFLLDFILRVFKDSEMELALGPFRVDAVEKDLTQAEHYAYKLSKILPEYVPIPWIVQTAWDNIYRRDLKLINNPGLRFPEDPASVPRAPRHVWLDFLKPGVGGQCSRQFGRSWPLKLFETDLQLGKIDIREVAALSQIIPEPGRTYSFDDLFPPGRFPGAVMGTCCGYHRDQRRKTLDAYLIKQDRPCAPRAPKVPPTPSSPLKKHEDGRLDPFIIRLPLVRAPHPSQPSPEPPAKKYKVTKVTAYFAKAVRRV